MTKIQNKLKNVTIKGDFTGGHVNEDHSNKGNGNNRAIILAAFITGLFVVLAVVVEKWL